MLVVSHIDHFVVTASSLDATCAFYERVLGSRRVESPGRPTALHFGTCKINVHEASETSKLVAAKPTPGSADFCLISEASIEDILSHLCTEGVAVEGRSRSKKWCAGRDDVDLLSRSGFESR